MFLAFPLSSRTNVPFFNTRFPHFPLFSAIFSSLAETVIGKVRVFWADKWFLVFRGRHECPPFCFYLLLLPCLSRMTFYERVLGSFLLFPFPLSPSFFPPLPFLFSPAFVQCGFVKKQFRFCFMSGILFSLIVQLVSFNCLLFFCLMQRFSRLWS